MIAAKIVGELEPLWAAVEPLRIGEVPAAPRTPDCFVLVEGEGLRLRCDVYAPKEQACTFEDAQVWRGLLVAGHGSALYWVNLATRAHGMHVFGGYFGSIRIGGDWCLVAFDDGLMRLAPDGSVIWRRNDLAFDGVIVDDVDGDIVDISVEMDPPGGWQERRVRLSTGANVED